MFKIQDNRNQIC